MARYVLLEDDPHVGLEAGDELECEPYWLDPDSKLIVKRRVHDGFDPECTVYRHQVGVIHSTGRVTAVPSDEDDAAPDWSEARFEQVYTDDWCRIGEGRWAPRLKEAGQ